MISLGFDAELAKKILKNTSNDLDSAIEALLDLQNVDNIPAQLLSLIDEVMPSTSGASNRAQGASLVDKIKKKVKMTLEEQEAYEMLKEDLEMEDDDYLNITLNQEEQLLIQYKNVLISSRFPFHEVNERINSNCIVDQVFHLSFDHNNPLKLHLNRNLLISVPFKNKTLYNT